VVPALNTTLELKKTTNMKKYGPFLAVLFIVLSFSLCFFLFLSLSPPPPRISSYWQSESAKFKRWVISSFFDRDSGNVIVGGTLFTDRSTRSPNQRYYKAGFKTIKVYLKDTLLTRSFDTVDFETWESKKVTSVKGQVDDTFKIELETMFQNEGNIIDTTFTLWNYKITEKVFVHQSIYQYILAWMYVLSHH
jgi:hypothetical protein